MLVSVAAVCAEWNYGGEIAQSGSISRYSLTPTSIRLSVLAEGEARHGFPHKQRAVQGRDGAHCAQGQFSGQIHGQLGRTRESKLFCLVNGNQAVEVARPYFADRGGPIILLQVENEYGSFVDG